MSGLIRGFRKTLGFGYGVPRTGVPIPPPPAGAGQFNFTSSAMSGLAVLLLDDI